MRRQRAEVWMRGWRSTKREYTHVGRDLVWHSGRASELMHCLLWVDRETLYVSYENC